MNFEENPFEKWGLSPNATKRQLTEEMRHRTRNLSGQERQQLQQDWRELMSDPVARARWTLLTPPRHSDVDDPWDALEAMIQDMESDFSPPPLAPTLEDALVLPILADEDLFASPPFLPSLLQDESRHGDPGAGK